jgi:hypothetical protein
MYCQKCCHEMDKMSSQTITLQYIENMENITYERDAGDAALSG